MLCTRETDLRTEISFAHSFFFLSSQQSQFQVPATKPFVGTGCNVPDLASLGNTANVCVGSKVYNIYMIIQIINATKDYKFVL
jgi:hypothetical protein